MTLFRRIKLLLPVLVSAFVFVNCSSSSYSSRYKKTEETQTTNQNKGNRFSSDNDTNPADDSSDIYTDPSDLYEFDEIPVEEYPVDTKGFLGKYENIGKLSSALTSREKMLFEVVKYLDTPYKYGGNDLNGIDCSGFTHNVFDTTLGISLPRTAREQYKLGEKINRADLEFGDLVFFNTTKRAYPGHVGIYIGENLFVHASRELGVTVSSMQNIYYNKRFVGARRIKEELTQ